MPYDRPPLTKELLRGEIDEDELPLEDEAWLAEHGVELISGRAVALDAAERTVDAVGRARSWRTRSAARDRSRADAAAGPGADDPRVRVVRSLDHVRELQQRLRDGDRGGRDRLGLHRLRDRRLAADARPRGRRWSPTRPRPT